MSQLAGLDTPPLMPETARSADVPAAFGAAFWSSSSKRPSPAG